MRIIILLYCVWLSSAGTVPEKCDGLTFNGKYYDKEVLINVEEARGLSYDKSTNTLFFSYNYPEGHFNLEKFFGIAYYNIDTKEFKYLSEVNAGFTTAVDTSTGNAYFGGSDGIYKFNSLNKTAEPYAAKGVDISYMYYNKILYYVTYPQYKIYSYDGKQIKKVINVEVQTFIKDGEKYFFNNRTGLYRVLGDKEENIEVFLDNGYKSFAMDNNNNIFITGCDCVYVPNEEKKKLDKITDIKRIRGLAFDKNNNVIYSDLDSIYRLTPSEANCPLNPIINKL